MLQISKFDERITARMKKKGLEDSSEICYDMSFGKSLKEREVSWSWSRKMPRV